MTKRTGRGHGPRAEESTEEKGDAEGKPQPSHLDSGPSNSRRRRVRIEPTSIWSRPPSLTTGVQLLARAPQRVLTHAGRVTVSCNGMLGGAPGALLKRPSREAPAGNGTPVGPIRLPEL